MPMVKTMILGILALLAIFFKVIIPGQSNYSVSCIRKTKMQFMTICNH